MVEGIRAQGEVHLPAEENLQITYTLYRVVSSTPHFPAYIQLKSSYEFLFLSSKLATQRELTLLPHDISRAIHTVLNIIKIEMNSIKTFVDSFISFHFILKYATPTHVNTQRDSFCFDKVITRATSIL